MSEIETLHRRFARLLLRRGASFFKNHPAFQRYVLAIIRKLGFYSIARAIYARMAAANQLGMRSPYGFIPADIAHLSPHARQIYADLKAAIERRQKEKF